ncbi:MAG: hypothetical protein B7X29_00105 [Halothiobacillus sp. 13-55-115]|nr:MAG: hypothetical protein B7X29_00105 [Halothiobacillus sp. 13-55-115]
MAEGDKTKITRATLRLKDAQAARDRAGLTQTQLAERMNTTQSNIARLESGKSLPGLRTLQRIAEATNSRASVTLTSR